MVTRQPVASEEILYSESVVATSTSGRVTVQLTQVRGHWPGQFYQIICSIDGRVTSGSAYISGTETAMARYMRKVASVRQAVEKNPNYPERKKHVL